MRISVGLDVESTQAINAEELATSRNSGCFYSQMPGELRICKEAEKWNV